MARFNSKWHYNSTTLKGHKLAEHNRSIIENGFLFDTINVVTGFPSLNSLPGNEIIVKFTSSSVERQIEGIFLPFQIQTITEKKNSKKIIEKDNDNSDNGDDASGYTDE